jgi:hypothetical protein
MAANDQNKLQEDLFYLLGYLLSSARGLYEEPADYGIFRLMDAATRLLGIMDEHDLNDAFLSNLKNILDEEVAGNMDETRQKETLERVVLMVATEIQNKLNS